MVNTIVRVLKTPVTLIALLVLVGYAATWGWAKTLEPIPPRPPEPCVVQKIGPKLTPEYVTLRVLNGGFSGGLGRKVGTVMRSWDFTVVKINNTDRRIQKTTIVGNSAKDPEVLLVAGFFVDPVLEGDGRTDHVVDVLLGSPFPGYVAKPVTSVPLPSGTACLPVINRNSVPSPSVTAPPKASPSASASATPKK